MVALFRKRWSEGRDVGSDETIADAAREAGADPDALLAAAHSDPLRKEAAEAWRRAMERDRIFGVPSFAYGDQLFWGQDRMQHLREAVRSGSTS